MNIEQWKDVAGYEGHYQVSSCGRVKSKKNGLVRILKHGKSAGYNFVNLLLNGVQKSYKIHRMVALSFLPNPDGKQTVNHKDGIKNNNLLSNLEWATYSENNIHALYSGLKKQVRPVVAKPVNGTVGFWFPSQSVAQRHGFHGPSISRVCLGQKITHKGYHWLFSCTELHDADMEAGNSVLDKINKP
jgi:hypothetical protein